MRIALVTDVIHAGGAETFVLRLAQALQLKGHTVRLFIFYKKQIDYNLIKVIAPDVEVRHAHLYGTRFWQKADGAFLKLGLPVSSLRFLFKKKISRFLKAEKIQVVHSHLFTADLVCCQAVEKSGIPVITTMHGDYTLYAKKIKGGEAVRLHGFFKKLAYVLKRVKEIVCITDEQLQFFNDYVENAPGLSLHKIYNGYQLAVAGKTFSKTHLKIPDAHFVFGMVARGIPEKGWQPVLDAFTAMNHENAWLILVGDSPFVQQLKQQYRSNTRIIFTGYSSNPVAYIRLFDVGLFASTYYAESLPTVLIEYLACAVPVVSVDIAECAKMLESANSLAGLIVSLQNGRVPVPDFAAAMQTVLEDKELYQDLKSKTHEAFKKFDMQQCVQQYEALYERHISNK